MRMQPLAKWKRAYRLQFELLADPGSCHLKATDIANDCADISAQVPFCGHNTPCSQESCRSPVSPQTVLELYVEAIKMALGSTEWFGYLEARAEDCGRDSDNIRWVRFGSTTIFFKWYF